MWRVRGWLLMLVGACVGAELLDNPGESSCLGRWILVDLRGLDTWCPFLFREDEWVVAELLEREKSTPGKSPCLGRRILEDLRGLDSWLPFLLREDLPCRCRPRG